MHRCLKCKKNRDDIYFPQIGRELKTILEQKYSNVVFSPICHVCINTEFMILEETRIEKKVSKLAPKDKSLIIFTDNIYYEE